jgi:hypothetical protein
MPALIPPSGARTQPHLPKAEDDAARTDVNVSSSAVLDERSAVGAVLDDLEQRSSVSMSAAVTGRRTLPEAPGRSAAGNFLLALLVLIAAGGAAAVVYFALPYLG